MFRKILAGAGFLALVVLPQHARANLLTNGDFETVPPGGTPHYNISAGDNTTIAGWTVTQGNVDLTNSSTNFYAQSGVQDVDLVGDNTLGPSGAYGATGIGGLSQAFTTIMGQTYQITLWYSHNYGATYGDGTTITSASASITVADLAATITDTSVWPGCPTNNSACVIWTEYTGTFTASSTLTTLTINNTAGGHNGGIYLDDVDIEPLVAGQTPLPAALPLFASGLGIVGLIARRKRKVAA